MMRTLTVSWIRCSIWCGVVTMAVAACGRAERPVGGDTASLSTAAADRPATSAVSDVRIAVAQKPTVGSYLTDDKGRSLYLFLKDSGGASACYDACAAAWPPILVANRPVASDTSMRMELLGASRRRDGAMQATYKDAPLYYYEDDKQPGDIEGQNKLEFGGRWYLVSPAGGKQEGKARGKGR